MSIEALRTPDERFAELPDFAYAPRYLDALPGYDGLRLHYVDEGPADGEVFLCLHGEPSWSFLYRKMAPVFLEAGKRVVAPDFFGFGRSDKPVDDAVYTWAFHRGTLTAFIERLDLRGITLVCQDWGGLLGLTLPMDMPERFDRILFMNTTLATGRPPGQGFESWKAYVRSQRDFPVGALMQRAVDGLSEAERAAYEAPFPDARFKAGVRTFPELVPVTPEMEGAATSRAALKWLRTEWRGQSFAAVGLRNPVLGAPIVAALAERIPGCPPPLEVPEGGHFVQEHGEGIARAALKHFGG